MPKHIRKSKSKKAKSKKGKSKRRVRRRPSVKATAKSTSVSNQHVTNAITFNLTERQRGRRRALKKHTPDDIRKGNLEAIARASIPISDLQRHLEAQRGIGKVRALLDGRGPALPLSGDSQSVVRGRGIPLPSTSLGPGASLPTREIVSPIKRSVPFMMKNDLNKARQVVGILGNMDPGQLTTLELTALDAARMFLSKFETSRSKAPEGESLPTAQSQQQSLHRSEDLGGGIFSPLPGAEFRSPSPVSFDAGVGVEGPVDIGGIALTTSPSAPPASTTAPLTTASAFEELAEMERQGQIVAGLGGGF